MVLVKKFSGVLWIFMYVFAVMVFLGMFLDMFLSVAHAWESLDSEPVLTACIEKVQSTLTSAADETSTSDGPTTPADLSPGSGVLDGEHIPTYDELLTVLYQPKLTGYWHDGVFDFSSYAYHNGAALVKFAQDGGNTHGYYKDNEHSADSLENQALYVCFDDVVENDSGFRHSRWELRMYEWNSVKHNVVDGAIDNLHTISFTLTRVYTDGSMPKASNRGLDENSYFNSHYQTYSPPITLENLGGADYSSVDWIRARVTNNSYDGILAVPLVPLSVVVYCMETTDAEKIVDPFTGWGVHYGRSDSSDAGQRLY